MACDPGVETTWTKLRGIRDPEMGVVTVGVALMERLDGVISRYPAGIAEAWVTMTLPLDDSCERREQGEKCKLKQLKFDSKTQN